MTIRKLFQYGVLGTFLLLGAPVAQADEPPQKPVQPKTQIITDEEEGVIHFIIDGKEIARIDSEGLHVNGDINYSGGATDTETYKKER